MQTAIVCGKLCTAPIGDYYVTCSFDSNHVILRSRMPYHIIKCIKNHPGHNKKQCPYDATEYIDDDQLTEHLLTCESKRSLNVDRYERADMLARDCMGKIQNTPYVHASAPEPDEEWGGPPDNVTDKYGITHNSGDDHVATCIKMKGVGRGTTLNKPTVPKKGMGRAALLEHIFREHLQKQHLEKSPSSEIENAKMNENVQNQFDNA